MSSSSTCAPTSLVPPTVLAAWAYVPKINTFFSSLANAPAPPSLEDQLANLLGNEDEGLLWEAESGGLTVSEPSPTKVDVYVQPLVELDLNWQAAIWAEAAEQRSVELTVEQEEILMREQATLIAQRTAKGRAAGILPPAPEPVAGPSGVNAHEQVAAEMVKLSVAAKGSDYEGGSSSNSNKDEDDEELPQTPKRSKTVGSGGPLPAVEKRATKLVTPSKCRANKIIPSYVPPAKMTFSDMQLHNLLVLHRDNVVLDTNQGAGESVCGIKSKKTASAKARWQFKLHKGACNKCWADNDPEACVKGLGMATQDKSKDKGKGKATVPSHKQRASALGSKWPLKQSQNASRAQPPSWLTAITSRELITPQPSPSWQRPSIPPMASLSLLSDQDKEEAEDPSNSPIVPLH
ncbi:hypothetical protein C0992_008539 [Termitomyces sp. T32_za158]|nr:hypothetical protein C0992_008539 [Termitomyces sp. T32_za158]